MNDGHPSREPLICRFDLTFDLLISSCVQIMFTFTDEPSAPAVQLEDASETSLNFTWNKYHHCNSDIVMVEYEFELRKADYNILVYSGSENNTFLSFNHLESHTKYNLRVRVSTFESLKGISLFSAWGSVNETTPKPVLGMYFKFALALIYALSTMSLLSMHVGN